MNLYSSSVLINSIQFRDTNNETNGESSKTFENIFQISSHLSSVFRVPNHPLDSLNTIRKKLRDWFGRKWAETWNIIWKISSRFSICFLISSNNISSILESPLREGEKPSSTGLTITVLACNRIPGARYSPSPSSFPRRTWTSCYTLGLRVNLVSVRIIVSRLDDCYGKTYPLSWLLKKVTSWYMGFGWLWSR